MAPHLLFLGKSHHMLQKITGNKAQTLKIMLNMKFSGNPGIRSLKSEIRGKFGFRRFFTTKSNQLILKTFFRVTF